MKSNTYFPHDANARHDEKILALRVRHGMEGYGVYFAILERLRENSDLSHARDYNLIAFELHAYDFDTHRVSYMLQPHRI
jgi:hypothetical protein